MNKNFQLRRDIYGDPCLGEDNLRMKQIADSFDCPGKFPGSGGAMVGICLHGECTCDPGYAGDDCSRRSFSWYQPG